MTPTQAPGEGRLPAADGDQSTRASNLGASATLERMDAVIVLAQTLVLLHVSRPGKSASEQPATWTDVLVFAVHAVVVIRTPVR